MAVTATRSLPEWYRRAAKAGLIAKGIVYCLSGIIALLAALNVGNNNGSEAGKKGVFGWIEHQPFGKWMVLALGAGLVCYTLWRWIQAFKDTEHKGHDGSGLSKRAAYLSSGFGYAGVAFYAFKTFAGAGGGGDQQKTVAAKLLHQPFGEWLLGGVAIGMAAVGVYQLYRAVSGKYKKHVRDALHRDAGGWVSKLGIAGYTARGVVWLIIGWFFARAAMNKRASEAGGTDDVFSWLEQGPWGMLLLSTVAVGLLCYGLFTFVRAKYQPIHFR
ncbi:MAG TPA: DUF1206 domain-containing protein [Chitinophagaceae bacterium]